MIEARRVAEQKPESCIVWSRLSSFLRIFHRQRMVALFQGSLRRVRKASILDVGSPPQRVVWSLRRSAPLLFGFLLRLGRRGGAYCVGLRVARDNERDSKRRHISNLQEAR